MALLNIQADDKIIQKYMKVFRLFFLFYVGQNIKEF